MPTRLPSLKAMQKKGQSLSDLLDQIDRAYVVDALNRASCNVSDAARLLGITRSTLHGKMRKYQVRVSQTRTL